MKRFALAATVAAVLTCLVAGAALAAELYVYNWTEYMPTSVIKAFEKETGIKVKYSTYDSNETMYAKLKSLSGKGYDLIFPSSYFTQRMAAEGLLQKLDKSKLTNLKNIDPNLLGKPFDPNNDYSVPYFWGTTGIGVNTKVVDPKTITSWKDLWRPEFKNKLLMTDDIREAFGMAHKLLGQSINTTDPKQIEAAYELLKELAPNVKVWTAESPSSVLLSNEAVVGMIWNGELYLANAEAKKTAYAYIYPKEGVNMWMDGMAIPAGAKNVAEAHAFINYVLRPQVAKTIGEAQGYSTPNMEAAKLMDQKARDNRVLFPTAEDLKNAEMIEHIGEAVGLYDRYWNKLKTGK